ncbi:c-type cytochrome [Flavobacterium sp. UBA7682]|uniref:c-type cytochrome n=1 Tax=Flavobacterium sp. UBA7682 TaxID=1946560 RepID=UPI0025BFBB6A|nr:c-type cytochrome [Flavobacterium sp. UBA7682]
MKKVGYFKSISKTFVFAFFFVLAVTSMASAQEGDAAKGKELFNANCAACHKLDAKATGPALRGVSSKYDKEWLYKWINNSSQLIKSGDAQAVKVFEEYNKVAMTAFPQLSTADIDNILAYTSQPKEEAATPVAGAAPVAGQAGSDSGISNNVILGALALVMALLVVMLFLVNKLLNNILKSKGLEVEVKSASVPLWVAFARNQFLVLVSVIFLLLVSAYFAYGYLMQVGVDQDYQPIQPIHYSHRIHAGENGIDCKYCHSAARVGKHSNIPSLNVCMNCHKNISEVAEATATPEHSKAFYDGEIQKLYDAVGWDKNAQKYTGKTNPVKWVRIHNLPDFVYFNHSQHVSVAGVECQTCHGPVEEMEVLKQHAPLTMGWCINCHRETNVKVEDNAYYEKIHQELSKKYGVDKLTAAQMGGLECGKCHY